MSVHRPDIRQGCRPDTCQGGQEQEWESSEGQPNRLVGFVGWRIVKGQGLTHEIFVLWAGILGVRLRPFWFQLVRVRGFQGNQRVLQGQGGGLGAVAGVQFGEDVTHIDPDGPRTERQMPGDLLVDLPGDEQGQDVPLPVRQVRAL